MKRAEIQKPIGRRKREKPVFDETTVSVFLTPKHKFDRVLFVINLSLSHQILITVHNTVMSFRRSTTGHQFPASSSSTSTTTATAASTSLSSGVQGVASRSSSSSSSSLNSSGNDSISLSSAIPKFTSSSFVEDDRSNGASGNISYSLNQRDSNPWVAGGRIMNNGYGSGHLSQQQQHRPSMIVDFNHRLNQTLEQQQPQRTTNGSHRDKSNTLEHPTKHQAFETIQNQHHPNQLSPPILPLQQQSLLPPQSYLSPTKVTPRRTNLSVVTMMTPPPSSLHFSGSGRMSSILTRLKEMSYEDKDLLVQTIYNKSQNLNKEWMRNVWDEYIQERDQVANEK